MIDLEQLRREPDRFRLSLTHRFMPTNLVDEVLVLDERYRQMIMRAEALRAERNSLTKTAQTAQAHHARLKALKRELEQLKEKTLADQRQQLAARLPNLLADDVPIGKGETANQPIKTIGKITHQEGLSHEELMTKLGWLDLLTAAQTSGARFRYLTGSGAIAQTKLLHMAFNLAVDEGFTPAIPPVLVRPDILEKGGFFPEGEEDTFKTGDLYLAGTSEYLLAALAMDKVYDESELPIRFVGLSTCFRKEAGSYGKDVRGMFRQHQFDKVELFSVCRPEDSAKEHKFLLDLQQRFVGQFDVPYRVVLIGSGDVEKKATKRFDLETWFPGQQAYRETHSVSNCTDYQARGLSIKYRNSNGDIAYAHTLNGTLATERLLLAIVENNQTDGGAVELPKELTRS